MALRRELGWSIACPQCLGSAPHPLGWDAASWASPENPGQALATQFLPADLHS